MTFIWSRAASFTYCGLRNGYGYRDTVQDIQGVIHLAPEMAVEKIRFMLSAQVTMLSKMIHGEIYCTFQMLVHGTFFFICKRNHFIDKFQISLWRNLLSIRKTQNIWIIWRKVRRSWKNWSRIFRHCRSQPVHRQMHVHDTEDPSGLHHILYSVCHIHSEVQDLPALHLQRSEDLNHTAMDSLQKENTARTSAVLMYTGWQEQHLRLWWDV